MAVNILRHTLINEATNVTHSPQDFKNTDHKPNKIQNGDTYKWDIVWFNVAVFVYLYVSAFYGLYLTFTVATWKTLMWSLFYLVVGTLGATAGSHRLWTHRTYKAKLPLRIMLAVFQTACFQNHIYEWVRDHRMHHKYTDTDADPHNATRGFFFSHVGWLMVRKHKDIKEKGKYIYMKDLEEDPVVMFQKRYYTILMPLCCFVIPALVPWYFWNEPFTIAWYTSVARYMVNVNGTWSVNSAAHLYGTRPYDKNIYPRENLFVGYIGFGEGWHNYHHVFPWDYKASEFNGYLANLTTGFIDFMATIGWAYDLKTASEEMIKKRMLRTGDRCDETSKDGGKIEEHLWGWGDENMSREDVENVLTYSKRE